MRIAKYVELSSDDDRRLRILSKRKRVEARAQLRARIVLLAADGTSDMDIAAALNIDRRVVSFCRGARPVNRCMRRFQIVAVNAGWSTRL